MMRNKKVTLAERQRIYQMRRLGYSFRAIGRELNREHSTILREIKKAHSVLDRIDDFYTQARKADSAAIERRRVGRAKRLRLKSAIIRHYVELHLREAHWSPETIAGKLETLGYAISYEAIYQFINWERPELKCCLWVAGRSRIRRRTGKGKRKKPEAAAPKRSIEQLPLAAKERSEIGHFELDAMLGKRSGGGAIQTKVDRSSRKLFLDKVTSLRSQEYADTLINRIKGSIPPGVLKTILEDNGVEHAEHQRVDAALGVQSYFCHPYCSSERGTVENRHQKMRHFPPRGTDFNTIDDDFIEWVEDYFNSTPMKVLGFKTPNQVWNEQLAQIK